MKKWKPGRVIESKHFYYMDSKFYLQVHPNGDSHKERGYVSIHLINDNPYSINVEWEIKLDTSLPYFEVKLSCVCLMIADRKK